MAGPIKPPWELENQQRPADAEKVRKRRAGNPAWTKGGPSPWPKGRPKGASARSHLVNRLLNDADGVVDAMICKALQGDVGAATLILSRIVPSLKAQLERVEFDFDPSSTTSDQLAQVLAAIADGSMPADSGKAIIETIKALADIRAMEELEARIEALEARGVIS